MGNNFICKKKNFNENNIKRTTDILNLKTETLNKTQSLENYT